MKFFSEQERLSHPQAGLIPSYIWTDDKYFGETLSERNQIFLTLSLDDLLKNHYELSPQDKLCALISVLIRYPDVSMDKILSFAQQLKCNQGALLHVYCLLGNTPKLDELKTKYGQAQFIQMFEANNCSAFRMACAHGHLPTAKWLKEVATPEQFKAMIKAGDYLAFKWACKKNHLPTAQWLLHVPSVFAYAEIHEQEYGEKYVHPFVTTTLQSLREDRLAFETSHPEQVYDNPDEAIRYFYILRNLIRRNDPGLHDDILLLLDIPAVKGLVHQEVTPNQPNELLRLALTTNNEWAATCLLALPAIRALAEANNYYADEVQGQLDLRVLAQDRESSMTALAGMSHLFAQLIDELEARYLENPATLVINKQTIKLPLSWEEFQALRTNLAEGTYQKALQAYYQHPTHTAIRYLSKPNHWMDKNASYVYVEQNNNQAVTARYSTFEEYKPLILLFWLAAIDETIQGSKNFETAKERLEYFIGELALIGRAHNWDKTRNRVCKADNTEINEEYDDLEGEKPSCFSGVKRRLFQSVPGHSLLRILTKDDIVLELHEFVRSYYQQKITPNNRQAINEAIDTFLDSEEINDTLMHLNITPEEQQQFIQKLELKYGDQFKDNLRFYEYLKIQLGFRGRSQGAHLLNFMDSAGLKQFLQEQSTPNYVPNLFKSENANQSPSANTVTISNVSVS